jgi:hypothetical protein
VVAGQIGLWGGFAGQAAGVLLSVFSDHVGGSKRRILLLVRAAMGRRAAGCGAGRGSGRAALYSLIRVRGEMMRSPKCRSVGKSQRESRGGAMQMTALSTVLIVFLAVLCSRHHSGGATAGWDAAGGWEESTSGSGSRGGEVQAFPCVRGPSWLGFT